LRATGKRSSIEGSIDNDGSSFVRARHSRVSRIEGYGRDFCVELVAEKAIISLVADNAAGETY
jgi:hypothetical protein